MDDGTPLPVLPPVCTCFACLNPRPTCRTVQVAEHHRQQRKEAKRHPHRAKKLSKDPGIPNLHPFKAQLMNQVGCLLLLPLRSLLLGGEGQLCPWCALLPISLLQSLSVVVAVLGGLFL